MAGKNGSGGYAQVLIIGGGPTGAITAIELGRRGVSCILLEEDSVPPSFPKANNTTSRTMEHYRRLGLADEIRALGLPDDYPTDVSYHTRFSTHELARLDWPTRNEVLAHRRDPNPRWPTPEPIHRVQQMLLEPVLLRHAASFASVDVRYGWRAESIAQEADGVQVIAIHSGSGQRATFTSDYALGCDGPRSIVRKALGIEFQGLGSEDREFLGGRMLATYFRSPAFYEELGLAKSWMYWGINPGRFGVASAIDGKERFVFHTQLPKGTTGTVEFARNALEQVVGRPFPFEIIGIAEWTAGFTLVAEHFLSGRVLIAGDAAHLFTPTSGLGYNTSVDDASNLAWKLAAVCQGWAHPDLLSTYETERQPIAHRNTSFARSIAEFFRQIGMPANVEEEGPAGDEARAGFGARLKALASEEFDTPGIQFGMFYGTSPVIAHEAGDAPADDPHDYVPTARPGARAPHAWLADRASLYDRFGVDFTLLKFDPNADTSPLEKAAAEQELPLDIVEISDPAIRKLYGADLCLVRPDQHVAWRGDHAPADPELLIRTVTGFEMHGVT